MNPPKVNYKDAVFDKEAYHVVSVVDYPTTNASVNPGRGLNNIRKSIRYMIAKTLGVHRKVSNIGVWGETGRYPLIYQSIKLALKYYRRVTELDHNSFAYAALCEQKAHNLPWYKNIESLLKLDEIYDLDHVTAHRVMKTTASKNNKNNHKTGPTIF